MPDTRKVYTAGSPIPGFKPGQAGYTVGPDKALLGITTHVTIDGYDTTGIKRKVRSFHLSFKDIIPQPVGKWAYNSGTDKYEFKGFANYEHLGIAAADRPDFIQKVNGRVSGLKTTFGSTGIGAAV